MALRRRSSSVPKYIVQAYGLVILCMISYSLKLKIQTERNLPQSSMNKSIQLPPPPLVNQCKTLGIKSVIDTIFEAKLVSSVFPGTRK